MPNDLFRWEDGGGLVHHCPVCQTPLSNAKSKRTCLGKHVEWCSRYHCQLFRKGQSGDCLACNHSDGQHEKHHRAIADLVRQLKAVESERPDTPSAPKSFEVNKQDPSISSPGSGSMSKKERKAAKKAIKIAEMPKALSGADVAFVAKILHPLDVGQSAKDAVEAERRLYEDPEIKLNMFFHKGTSNTRATRHEFIVVPRREKKEPTVAPAELDTFINGLGVKTAFLTNADEAKTLIVALRTAIENNIVNVEKEHQQTMTRKGGFWRWASRKAYNRLVDNGMLWDEKGDDRGLDVRKDSAVEYEDIPPVGTHGEAAEHRDINSNTETHSYSITSQSSICSQSNDMSPVSSADDEWTKVGEARFKPRVPTGKIRLSSNGGLAKLLVTSQTKFGALAWDSGDEKDE